MAVVDFTFPQTGDNDYAENFGTWLGRSNITDYVEEGMSTSISDASVPEITITEGKAFVDQATAEAGSTGEDRPTLDYVITRPQTVLDDTNSNLTDNDVNYVYLTPNFGTNDSPSYTIYQNTANSTAEELQIAEVDLSNDTVDNKNRNPDETVDNGTFAISLKIPVYADTSNAQSNGGNIVWIDGSSSQDEGLYQHDGSSYSKVNVDSITEIADVTGVTALIEDTGANRPAAGTEGRIFFDTSNDRVEYDNGSSWEILGANPSNIGAGDLGFDTATQSELDSHASTSNAHHTRPSAGSGLTDSSNTFNVDEYQSFTVNIGTTKIEQNEFTSLLRTVAPAGADMEIMSVSIANDSHSAPTGLNLVVRNVTAAANETTFNQTYNEGSPVLTTVSNVGGDSLTIAADNGDLTGGTTSTQLVTAHMKFRFV